ncbi:NAD-dependent DNA ligase LigA [Candidatus Pelagibacter sp. HIMB1623]|uniref:NAD-dependent DNA ligase LigA n=1 Tax=unclassified Candidatus Pelagibacter TaxID=2647897 RepID=UPI003F8801EF
MNKKVIQKKYNNKIRLISKYNSYYYDKSEPIVNDEVYDNLKKEILQLEIDYEFLNSEKSPSKIVGYKPSKNFKKSSHKVPMLSLGNAFSEEDLNNFEKKIKNFLSIKENINIYYSAEPKIDGISASLTYIKGKFHKGLSRGDGKEGEDITLNLETIDDIPKVVLSEDFPEEIDIRGEVFIQNSDFKNLNNKFANPRNAASGSLRQKNPNDTKKIPLKFIAYTFGYEKGLLVENQSDFIKKLSKWGFKTNPLNKLISGVKNLIENYNEIEKKRANLDFDIDGIVYKINDFAMQKRLGNVANAPRWAIAHKFSSNKAISQILDIEIQVGRTGALTPVAKIKPINIGGVVVSNATLHNEDEINRKDIRIGDTAVVERAGDVIPHILSVDLKKRSKNSLKFVFPKKCPSCGSVTIKDFNSVTKKIDAVRRCSSEGYYCEKISIEKLKHFVSKEAFNIDGLGKKIVEGFWKQKFIKYPQDIFKLNYDKIEKLEGWGKLSVENLKYSINQRKNISLERFIYSLGIRHIGLENAKLLSKYFVSFLKFKNLSTTKNYEDLLNIDGIGDTQIKSIKSFFINKENIQVLNELEKVLIIKNATSTKKDGILKNKTFLVTGKLNNISRAEVKSLIEENSGTTVSTVSKKLDYLITGEKPTKKKIDNAKQLKIKIIDQGEFLKMLNKTS